MPKIWKLHSLHHKKDKDLLNPLLQSYRLPSPTQSSFSNYAQTYLMASVSTHKTDREFVVQIEARRERITMQYLGMGVFEIMLDSNSRLKGTFEVPTQEGYGTGYEIQEWGGCTQLRFGKVERVRGYAGEWTPRAFIWERIEERGRRGSR